MNNPRKSPDLQSQDEEDAQRGPNLVLIYSLIALAFLIAFALAALIVWPFFKAR